MAELELTRAQQEAVENRGGAILVSAAAGSGKTRVLVERLMRQLCDERNPHDVDEYLIITFTKKAAAELRSRIAKGLTKRLADNPGSKHLQRQLRRIYLAKIMTVDAFCADLLHEYAYQLNLPPDFRVAEETELFPLRQKIVAELLEEASGKLDSDAELRALIDNLGAGRNDTALQALVLAFYDETRCHLSEEEWLRFCADALNTEGYTDAAQTPWGKYLIAQLHDTVRDCRFEFSRLAKVYETSLGEPYGALLRSDAASIEPYLLVDTWDAINALGMPSYNRKPSAKKCPDSALDAELTDARDACKDTMKKALELFRQNSETVLAHVAQTTDAMHGLLRLVPEFAKRYDAEKERLHIRDFADLEHGALRLLLQKGTRLPTRIAKEISARYTEIMVDEYQDTNEIQDAIYKAISKDGKNRFMVGDIKQSIYRFRLADPTIFLKKYKTYRDWQEASGDEPRRILLSDNFRSGKEILEAANAVFSKCMSESVGDLDYGPEEALSEGIAHTPLPYTPVELHCIETSDDDAEESPDKYETEAVFVAARLRRMLDEQTPVRCKEGLRPVQPGDIAILLRSMTNRTVQCFLQALAAHGIPAVCERGASLLDTEELECLMSLLQLLDNAHLDVPLASVLLSPVFGIPANRLARIRATNPYCDLYDALRASDDPDAVKVVLTLQTLRSAVADLPLHALLEEINRVTGFDSVYAAMPDGETRLDNLRRFRELAAAFEDGGKRSLHQFINYLEITKESGLISDAAANPHAVNLMTVHKSKGLEFPVVVLAGLSKQFNKDDAKQAVLTHPAFGAACGYYDEQFRLRYPTAAKKAIAAKQVADSVSEEMRVLYVAMTRAQDCLIMTYCAADLQKKLTKLAQRVTLPPEPCLVKKAVCPGDWILITALLRTEAGELFTYAAQPEQSEVSELPWRICLHRGAGKAACAAAEDAAAPETAPPDLRMINYRYSASDATVIPGKVTATQLKGRILDGEIDDNAPTLPVRFRQPPLFLEERPLSPTERGVATHLAMQYLDFAKTGSEEEIAAELRRLVRDEFLTQKQADAVAPEKLLRVFDGPLGAQIKAADEVIREFKFSILVDAGTYFRAEPGEQVMLQGVTDCCLIKDGALTVVDFKTDRVAKGGEADSAAHYKPQLEAYSLALSRIFGLPVTKRILYYFQTDTAIEV